MTESINESFIFNQIHKYNSAKRLIYQDAALKAVARHVGLIESRMTAFRILTPEERQRVLEFLRSFLQEQGVKAEIREILVEEGNASA
jgi:hypothetical protein